MVDANVLRIDKSDKDTLERIQTFNTNEEHNIVNMHNHYLSEVFLLRHRLQDRPTNYTDTEEDDGWDLENEFTTGDNQPFQLYTGFGVTLMLILIYVGWKMRKRRQKTLDGYQYDHVGEYDELLQDTFLNDEYTQYDSDDESIASIISEYSRDGKDLVQIEMNKRSSWMNDDSVSLSEANG